MGVVTLAVVAGTRSKSSVAGGSGGGNSSDFGVMKVVVTLLALPELGAGATGVVVGGTRAETLLFLVVTSEKNLDRNRNEEEESSNDSDGEASSVELASGTERCRVGDLVTITVATKALLGIAGTIAEGSVDIASAAGSTIASEDCDSDHGTAAKDVEDQAEQSKECLSAQAAGEHDSEDGVENCSTGQTSDGLLPAWDRDIAISLDCEEVGVDSKDDRSAAKLEGIECRRDELQRSTAESHDESLDVELRRGETEVEDEGVEG